MAGSIEKRGKNSYRLTVSEGFDLDGKPMIHRKTIHGTKKDAEVELAKFVTEVQNGLVIDGKSLKFSEFTEIWNRLLRAMLHRAVYWQLIVSNPVERVQSPKARKPKFCIFR